MKFFWLLCFLILPLTVHAADGLSAQIFPLNAESRFERSMDQELVQRQPRTLAAGIRYALFSALFEASEFSDKTGNSTLGVDRTLQSYLLWGRMHYYNQNYKELDFSFYAGIAAGVYQESISTTLSGIQSKDPGTQAMAGGLCLGFDTSIFVYKNLAVITAIEFRLLGGQDFDPNPQFSGVWRLGIQF
jgi:hypothetical protein